MHLTSAALRAGAAFEADPQCQANTRLREHANPHEAPSCTARCLGFRGFRRGNWLHPRPLSWQARPLRRCCPRGILGIAVTIAVVTKLHWLSPSDRRGAFLGAIVGFGIAVPIAVTNLRTPIMPILSCGLVGAGLLFGVGLARGWKRGA